jgi:hypothetical protein
MGKEDKNSGTRWNWKEWKCVGNMGGGDRDPCRSHSATTPAVRGLGKKWGFFCLHSRSFVPPKVWERTLRSHGSRETNFYIQKQSQRWSHLQRQRDKAAPQRRVAEETVGQTWRQARETHAHRPQENNQTKPEAGSGVGLVTQSEWIPQVSIHGKWGSSAAGKKSLLLCLHFDKCRDWSTNLSQEFPN